MTKKKPIYAILLTATLVITLAVLVISSSFAYFRSLFDKQGTNTVMVELIFDHLDFEDPDIIATGKYAAVDEGGNEIPWGSEKNPYVISQKYHVQNLSVLQNAGFFKNRVQTDSNGNPVTDANGATIPLQTYFLVCTPQGEPVTIDCEGMTISPVGTHDLPFTGCVGGAPIDGNALYNNLGTSVSTIANLKVESKLDEPDIGFFGKLSYYGTYNDEDKTVTGGYAAKIDNLLFADVTIVSQKSILDTIVEWWNNFIDHVNHVEKRNETNHVGIVAGHAEFATLTRISVYYSEGVEAFNLVANKQGSNTNYYSSTGIIGLLQYVNPTYGENGTLEGDGGIVDDDIIGDGSSGAGGSESGTMTGYFLAKNLFDRHQTYLTAAGLAKKDKYNVMEMKDGEAGGDLFKTVTMRERSELSWNNDNWEKRTYFYFQDTVFTFAMSMSVPEGSTIQDVKDEESDYIQVIWKLDEEAPSIAATDSYDKLTYDADPKTTPRISYYLEALEKATNLSSNGYYVIGYYEKNGTPDDRSDDILYLLDITNVQNTKYMTSIPIGELSALGTYDEELTGDISYYSDEEGGGLKSLYLSGTNKKFYNYAFLYDSANSATITNSSTGYKFGVTATGGSILSYYSNPTTTLNQANANTGNIKGDPVYYYNWGFTEHSSEKGRFSIASTYEIGAHALVRSYCWTKLAFSATDGISFYSVSENRSSDLTTQINNVGYSDQNYFTVFKINTNTTDSDGKITALGAGNEELTPKNIIPVQRDDGNGGKEPDILYTFDPSKYVLQYTGTSIEGSGNNAQTIGNYKLAPIRYYRLNNGMGDLLSDVNHIAKLYKTHNENYQLTIGNTFLGNFIGNWGDLNEGGVLNTTIGTSNNELYSIPTGMIAFEINEASVAKPSYINIIVAVNPEQETSGTIGLWEMNKQTWQQSFTLNNPTQQFELPISITARSSADKKYTIKVSERVVETTDAGKRVYTTVTDANGDPESSYIYLGGETVLVYHTFEVTKPDTVYMLGSKAGPFSVAYFSVSGAAGAGNDGTGGSPLGSIDFVYSFGGNIITVDRHYTEDDPILSDEDYSQYYPSYLFVSMLPEETKIQNEVVKIYRYINASDQFGTKRRFSLKNQNLTELRGASPVTEDIQDDIE